MPESGLRATELSADEAATLFGEHSETNPKDRQRLAAYTSFDGDHVADVPRMCFAAAVLDYLPLNPEAALGYYVSTVSLGNQKTEVMMACLAVEFKADELWIVTKGGPGALATLPEGVVAEYLLWREMRPDLPVRHFPWLADSWREFLADDTRSVDEVLEGALLMEADHARVLDSCEPAYLADLNESLLNRARASGMPPVAFLSSDEADDKHIDWARRYAYVNGRVGFSPSTLVPKIVSDMLGHDDQQRRLLRDEAIVRSDEFWVFARPSIIQSRRLPPVLVEDVHSWLATHPGEPIRLVGWDLAEVPKYDPSVSWALTDAERREK